MARWVRWPMGTMVVHVDTRCGLTNGRPAPLLPTRLSFYLLSFSSLFFSLALSLHLSLPFPDVKVEQYFRSASICASSRHFCFFSSFVFWSRLYHHSFWFSVSCETTLLIASWIAHSRPYPLLFTGTSQDDGIVRQDNQFNLY